MRLSVKLILNMTFRFALWLMVMAVLHELLLGGQQ